MIHAYIYMYHTCSTSPSPHSQTAPPLCGVVLCLYLACPLGNTPSPAVRPMQEARVKVPEEDHRVISDARDGLLVLGSILLPCNHLPMQRGACNGGEYNLQSRIGCPAAVATSEGIISLPQCRTWHIVVWE